MIGKISFVALEITMGNISRFLLTYLIKENKDKAIGVAEAL
jgi:hypothetical protein